MKTNDTLIGKIMERIHNGQIQLPDFQRPWVWDDNRIIGLIASITSSYPIGATMFLNYGNPDIQFQCKCIEGAPICTNQPEDLVLDGQQRLTSIYNALYSPNAVKTVTETKKQISRYYYIDIAAAIDKDVDRVDAIISVPDDKKIKRDFGKEIVLDLSTSDCEYKEKKYPLNIILDNKKAQEWTNDYYKYHNYNPEIIKEFIEFQEKIVMPVNQYTVPIITLDKETPKEAVCQVFEKVNTGGVALNVFELVTAIFAMKGFKLREDWDKRKAEKLSGKLTTVVSNTDFLTACTLLVRYKSGGTVSCKKRDVLKLTKEDYEQHADALTEGFVEAEKLLKEERIFSSKNLPYPTQLLPLAVICTILKENGKLAYSTTKDKLTKWYWCGVFGELYGSANETRYANDVVGVIDWVCNSKAEPKTIGDFSFNPTRLLTLKTRQSAAYKGVMALFLKNKARDFISDKEMDEVLYDNEYIDIHHIFPQDYCKDKYPETKWNCVVNKTMLTARSNRIIGGSAPSLYLDKIVKQGYVDNTNLMNDILLSHKIDISLMRNDDFDAYFVARAKAILNLIENATGKQVTGRDTDDVIAKFGASL